jgi:DNA-binding Lrp family transcriptional regulator
MSKGNFFMPQPTSYRPRPNTYRIDNIFIDEYARRIGPIGVAVYNVLSRHADRDSGLCRIGINKISSKLNLSRTSVKKYLYRLFTEGLIAIIPQYREQGGQTANHYLLLDISPEGRARRGAQFNALIRGEVPQADSGGSPRDLPPSLNDHLATGARSPNDPIQPSYSQDILPRTLEDDLPPIQRTCPHPDREVMHLSDGITICNRCYKLLDTAASETIAPTPPPTPPSDNEQHTQQSDDGGSLPETTPDPDADSEATSENTSEAT